MPKTKMRMKKAIKDKETAQVTKATKNLEDRIMMSMKVPTCMMRRLK